MVEGNGRAKPVYHLFIDLATSISQRVTLITPARYLFNVGFTPEDWNRKMLSDEHFRVVRYEADSRVLFPSVDIKGGVAIMYRDCEKDFGKIGAFTPYRELDTIVKKVLEEGDRSLTEIIYAESSYRFDLSNSTAAELVQTRLGNDKKIISNIFDKLPDIFTQEKKPGTIGFHGRTNSRRCIRYADRNLFENHPNVDKYKVIVAESNGSGSFGEILSSPFIGEPKYAATQTFLTIGAFDTRYEAEACLKYIKGKFSRTLLGALKATQHNPKDIWKIVPLQDFTKKSDIDWSLSIDRIDEQLYHKYNLSQEETQFVEEMVKPMK